MIAFVLRNSEGLYFRQHNPATGRIETTDCIDDARVLRCRSFQFGSMIHDDLSALPDGAWEVIGVRLVESNRRRPPVA